MRISPHVACGEKWAALPLGTRSGVKATMLAILLGLGLAGQIEAQLASPPLRGAIAGVCVRGLTDPTPVDASRDGAGAVTYLHNADVRLMPASNEKLFTIAYAIKRLGLSYCSKTRIWKRSYGAYVDAPGNPTTTADELRKASLDLGLRPGAQVHVREAYAPQVPDGWESDDMPNRYAAQPCSFSVDKGGFELWGERGRAFLLPYNYGVRVHVGAGSRGVRYDIGDRQVTYRGRPPRDRTRLDTLAVPVPDEAAATVLGGRLVRVHDEPPTEPPTTEIISAPLSVVARDCLQNSDNYLAENLLLIAAASEGPLGDDPYKTASQRIRTFLESEVGVEAGDVRPVDGSGLSRHNFATPRSLAKVLVYAYQQWGTQWTDLLATSGKGTLEKRLAGSSFIGKTGTLDGVVALSGYVFDKSKIPHVISLVFNHTIAPSAEIRPIQDSIVRMIESIDDGTDFESYDYRERSNPHPSNPPLRWNWLCGPGDDGGFAFTRQDR